MSSPLQKGGFKVVISNFKTTKFKNYLVIILSLVSYTLFGQYSLPTGTTNVASIPTSANGVLTIPAGANLNLNTTTAIPAGITEIIVKNGGNITVTVDYIFPITLSKLTLEDADLGGNSPSGSITFDGNKFLTLSTGTLLIIQNTITQEGSPGAAIITDGPCSQAVRIYIGTNPYAACNNPNGAGVCFTYNEVIANGGTPQLTGDVSISGAASASGNKVCFNNQPFNLNAILPMLLYLLGVK
jgi:hypothetical protein